MIWSSRHEIKWRVHWTIYKLVDCTADDDDDVDEGSRRRGWKENSLFVGGWHLCDNVFPLLSTIPSGYGFFAHAIYDIGTVCDDVQSGRQEGRRRDQGGCPAAALMKVVL